MQAFTVSAVVAFLRELLEANEILSDLWIAGEVSNYTRSQPGHRYFSLKDGGGVLRSVLFRTSMPGLEFKNGDRVLAHGRVSVYQQRGELQFVCDFVRPEGIGLQAAQFEELKLRLEAEGLFEPGRKRALPRFPMRVGVVTSPTGAALQDIQNVLARRWPLATLVIAPANVQGKDAPTQIAAALRLLAREPGLDVAILARGGGSAEDLSAFNSEAVARAIFAFPVPLVSGVGHETDETIADFVADMRAPTPSAAVERATPDIRQVTNSVAVLERAMGSAARSLLGEAAGSVDSAALALDRMVPDPRTLGREVEMALRAMRSTAKACVQLERARIETAAARLDGLDPHATLARGFAIVQDAKTRKIVSSVRKVKSGARLSVAVADGAFWTEVS